MYAFGGFEDVSSMAKDVKFKNFKIILMSSFAFILTFYFIFYLILIFIDNSNLKNFSQIFQITLGNIGLIIFVIGLIFNSISSRISVNISNARKLIALNNDGFLLSFINKQNKKEEYKMQFDSMQ